MKKVNTLVLCKDDYKSEELWQQEIGRAIMLLANARYIMVAKLEEIGIFRIDYEYDSLEYGTLYPYWLLPDEYESVVFDEDESKVV